MSGRLTVNCSVTNCSLFDVSSFDIDYYPAAVRNLITMSPGLISIIMLTSILTVVFLTYGGFALAVPILCFNIFMCIVIPFNDPPFLISTLACSLIKQFCAATMNSAFAISCVGAISLLRYVLVMHGRELNLLALVLIYFLVALPLYIYFILAFFVGTITNNDECPLFIEINWIYRPVIYFGYLSVIILATDFCNIRILVFLVLHRRKITATGHKQLSEGFSRKERDQLHLSIGLLVQSITVTCTFGSTILFMLLFSYGIAVPAWLSTITNTLSSISTLLNPLAAAIFIRPFRREMLRTIMCSKNLVNDVMGPSSQSRIAGGIERKISMATRTMNTTISERATSIFRNLLKTGRQMKKGTVTVY